MACSLYKWASSQEKGKRKEFKNVCSALKFTLRKKKGWKAAQIMWFHASHCFTTSPKTYSRWLGGLVGVAQLLGLWPPDDCMSNCVFFEAIHGMEEGKGSLPDLILPILVFCCCTIIHHELNDFTDH